jgi:hypothetical protein
MGLAQSLLRLLLRRSRRSDGFLPILQQHFGTDPRLLPVVAESFEATEQPNFHLAMEAYRATDGRSVELHGIAGAADYPP